jgi:stage II sporulation protein D
LKLSNIVRLAGRLYTLICRSPFRAYSVAILSIAAIVILFFFVKAGCRSRETTSPIPDFKSDEQYWVRVLLLSNIQQCSIRIDSNFNIEEENASLQSTKRKTEYKPYSEPFGIQILDGKINIAGRNYISNRINISPENSYIFSLNEKQYRGKVRLIGNPDGKTFNVINLVPLEVYIAGVVGAEMPDYWEPEALKSQAIAARTYCLFIKRRFGSNRAWDLNKTAANQVYLGIEAESVSVWKAVNETSGMVLTCRQSDGREGIFPAYYCSTCGGHTENSENVFGDSYEPLKGVSCLFCKEVAKPEIFSWPDLQYEIADVNNRLVSRYPIFKRLGGITEITAYTQNNYDEFSRITRLKISGPGGSEFLRAEDFRLTLDPTGKRIKSTAFKLETSDNKLFITAGRGWGHGVGMCQCGVEGMAREGKKAEEILQYYYPGSQLLKLQYDKKL